MLETAYAGERRIGIIGAGTMGASIAQGAAQHGFEVVLFDVDGAVAEKAAGSTREAFGRLVAKGRMTAEAADAASARLKIAGDLKALGGTSLVIEAIVEAMAPKKDLFAALTPHLAPETLIATNTSALSVTELGAAVARPERFLGLHYFFPAAVNPLLEVIRGAATSDTTAAQGLAFGRATAKQPILCRDRPGFAVNRFFVPYLNEAARLVDEGYDPGEIDQVARVTFKTAAGPFRVMDLTKPIIAVHAARSLAPLGAFYVPAPSLVRVGESGQNWSPARSAEVTPERAAAIAARLQGAVFLAVLQALDEEVASPADMDQGARLGLQWEITPWAAMTALGQSAVEALLRPLLARDGTPAPAFLGRVSGTGQGG